MATLTVQGVLLLGAFWGVFGINVDELSGELEKRLESEKYRDYFPDNLIKISSWNVRYIPTRTICNFIEKTKPMVRSFLIKSWATDNMLFSICYTLFYSQLGFQSQPGVVATGICEKIDT